MNWKIKFITSFIIISGILICEDNIFGKDSHWIKGAVGYKIYIDTFKNGDIDNDPIFNNLGMKIFSKPRSELRSGMSKASLVDGSWGENDKPEFFVNDWTENFEKKNEWEKYSLINVGDYDRYYGGDLKGIEEKLDYIKDLGVDYIILSSPFYSNSNHKYNPIYLHHIDPHFGTLEQRGINKGIEINSKVYNKYGEKELNLLKFNEEIGSNKLGESLQDENTWVWTDSDLEFVNLIQKIHKKNMKIIVEITIDNFENLISKLPSEEKKNYIFNSMKKWILGPDKNLKGLDGIDGIKYVYYNSENNNILEINNKLKSLKKDLVIMEDNDKGNYGLVDSLIKYTVNDEENYKISSLDFAKNLIKNYESNGKLNINYISSLDTDRIFSSVINGNRIFDKNNKNDNNYLDIRPDLYDKNALDKFKRIVSVQMMSLGSPVIYYGDEKGMWGSDGPRNRKPMLWEEYLPYEMESDNIEKYLLKLGDLNTDVVLNEALGKIFYPVEINTKIEQHYKKLLEIRKNNKELFENGKFRILEVYGDKETKNRIDEDIKNYLMEEERKSKIYRNKNIRLNIPSIDFVTYEIYKDNRSIMIIINNSDEEYPLNLKVSKLFGFYKDLINEGENYSVYNRMINVIVRPYEVKILYNSGKYF